MPKKRQNFLFSLLSAISLDSILPLQRLFKDVTAQHFGKSFHLRTRSVCQPAMGISVKTFYACQLETALYFQRVRNIFDESAIYLGYITTKLSISKGCTKIHRLFILHRMTFLWCWERGLHFLRSPFVL